MQMYDRGHVHLWGVMYIVLMHPSWVLINYYPVDSIVIL